MTVFGRGEGEEAHLDLVEHPLRARGGGGGQLSPDGDGEWTGERTLLTMIICAGGNEP